MTEKQKQWAKEHRDHLRAYHKKWRDANPDKVKVAPEKKRVLRQRYKMKDPEKFKRLKAASRLRTIEQVRQRDKEYYANNKAKFRAYSLKKKFGITAERFNQMYAAQEGRCAICDRSFGSVFEEKPKHEKLCVDHNHKTGAVRALLCLKCNAGLGLFDDDPIRTARAVVYLEKYRGQ